MDCKHIGRYAKRINKDFNRYMAKKLCSFGVGRAQLGFLLDIHCNQGISQDELAQLGGFDKATITRAVRKLMELGYVERVENTHCKKTYRLYTTEKTLPLIDQYRSYMNVWETVLSKGIDPEKRDIALETLKQMSDNGRAFLLCGCDEDPLDGA